MARRRRPSSRAALLLADAGLTLDDVASRLGLSPQALSLQLSGKTKTLHPSLADTLTALVGPKITGEILATIPKPGNGVK